MATPIQPRTYRPGITKPHLVVDRIDPILGLQGWWCQKHRGPVGWGRTLAAAHYDWTIKVAKDMAYRQGGF